MSDPNVFVCHGSFSRPYLRPDIRVSAGAVSAGAVSAGADRETALTEAWWHLVAAFFLGGEVIKL